LKTAYKKSVLMNHDATDRRIFTGRYMSIRWQWRFAVWVPVLRLPIMASGIIKCSGMMSAIFKFAKKNIRFGWKWYWT